MAIGDLFKKKDEQGKEHLWSLVIGRAWVESGVWRVSQDKVEVVAEGGVFSWQEGDQEALIQAADSSLSAAAANLADEIEEPSKVVFGLPISWTSEGKIKSEQLDFLKKLSSDLELNPVGFVSLQEAVVHFVKSREGVPPNAIFVGLVDESIDVSLVEGGKIVGNFEVARSMALGADVAEGLARLPSKMQYPSRIIVYNHKAGHLEDARQALIDTDWEGVGISFLHTPKVEVLDEDVGVVAVSLAGGAEVSGAVGVVKKIVLERDGFGKPLGEESGKKEEETTSVSLKGEADPTLLKPQGAGGQEEYKPEEEELEEVDPNSLGFVEGDVAEVVDQQSEEVIEEIGGKERKPYLGVRGRNFLKGVGYLVVKFVGGFRLLGVVGFLLVAVVVGGFAFYWYVPKAHVTIYVSGRELNKAFKFRVDSGGLTSDKEKVPGRLVAGEVSGERTQETTGTKVVGERASGTVTIYHVGVEAKLNKGTQLVGPEGLKFTLDEDVTVGAGGSLTNPSKTKVSVTAAEVGAQYNLVSRTEFSVANFSKNDFVAQNEEAFSGGVSREVTAVAKEDLAKLKKDLSEELLRQGVEELKKNVGAGDILLEDSAFFKSKEEIFSHKEGEDTATIKLSLKGDVSLLVVKKDDLNSLVKGSLEGDVPDGFVLKEEQVEIGYKLDTSSKEGNSFEANVRANLLPKINSDEVAKAIVGKYPDLAREYLASTPGFVRAEITFRPGKFPGKLGTLPRLSENIQVEVLAQ